MNFICGILLLSLFGCSTTDDDVVNLHKEPHHVMGDAKAEKLQVVSKVNQADDFNVSIHVDENLITTATITYVGNEAEKTIYHASNIFSFNIYQQDGGYKYEPAMFLPLKSTTLIQNQPHTITLNTKGDVNLEKGLYEFKVIANFSLNANDVVGTKRTIPVSKLQEV